MGATVFVKREPDCLVVESEKVELRGAPTQLASAVENARFKMRLELGDTVNNEVTLQGNTYLARSLENVAMNDEDALFESVGNGAMGVALSTLFKGFAHSFVEEYMKWSKDAAFPLLSNRDQATAK